MDSGLSVIFRSFLVLGLGRSRSRTLIDDLREREALLLRALWTISKGSMRSPYSPYTYINKIICLVRSQYLTRKNTMPPPDASKDG